MIITFCGHSTFCQGDEYMDGMLGFLEERIGGEQALFYLGGYGGFDDFAFSLAKRYQKKHADARLIYVTPYMDASWQRTHIDHNSTIYDEIIYPELEKVPRGAAIIRRNYFMADRADFIIAYISYTSSGAYKMYSYAKKKGKEIYNIGKIK